MSKINNNGTSTEAIKAMTSKLQAQLRLIEKEMCVHDEKIQELTELLDNDLIELSEPLRLVQSYQRIKHLEEWNKGLEQWKKVVLEADLCGIDLVENVW